MYTFQFKSSGPGLNVGKCRDSWCIDMVAGANQLRAIIKVYIKVVLNRLIATVQLKKPGHWATRLCRRP